MSVTLGEAFESFAQDALRLEGLSSYNVEEEQEVLAQLRDGRELDMSFLDSWHEHLEAARLAGKSHRRVRLVSEPWSGYERFEIQNGYRTNARHGEEIRLLARSHANAELPDCWIFDSELVFVMNYDAIGAFMSAELIEDGRALIERVEALFASATPIDLS